MGTRSPQLQKSEIDFQIRLKQQMQTKDDNITLTLTFASIK